MSYIPTLIDIGLSRCYTENVSMNMLFDMCFYNATESYIYKADEFMDYDD